MLRPKCNITITKSTGEQVSFNFVTQFEINEGYEFLTNTAQLILPRKITQTGIPLFTGTDPLFKRKDKIKIEAGYFPNSRTLFEGYISHVSANVPTRLECEDNMFLMKQFKITYPKEFTVQRTSSKTGRPLKNARIISENIKLSQLMGNIFEEGQYQDMLDGISFEILDDINLGQFRATNATPAQVFEKLRTAYGLFTYFVGNKLYCGFANNAGGTNEATFKMEKVCINSNELDYQRAEDITIRVKYISILPDNTRLEAEAGDSSGEQRTYHVYNVTSQADLQKMAQKRVDEYKYTGFRGYFETFGEPYLTHGDRLTMESTKLPERNGTYLIKSVRRLFGVEQGFRQLLELGVKISE